MKTVSLSGSPRENVGKKDAKGLRKKGLVPCVAYGGTEQLHFFLDERDFTKLLFTPETYIVKLKVGDKEIQTLLQDVQYHPVTDKILHADFLQFDDSKPVKTAIPVKTTGASIGVLKGGSMKLVMRKLVVKALAKNIPDYIEVDISKIDIGSAIRVKDLKVEGIEFMDRPNNVVVTVKVTRVKVDIEEEEGEEGEGTAEGGEGAAEGGEKPAEGGDAPAE
jgi:large subunit ribosomal protein L25